MRFKKGLFFGGRRSAFHHSKQDASERYSIVLPFCIKKKGAKIILSGKKYRQINYWREKK
jgi:hypothetical protein